VFIGVSYAGMGHIHYEWNALEDASNAFEQAITIARPWNNWETLVSAGVGLARARFARQDLPGALAILDEMDARWQEMYHGGPLPIFLGWRALLTRLKKLKGRSLLN
jgi:hypothetical protein